MLLVSTPHFKVSKAALMKYRWVILFFGILAYGTSQFARQNFNGIQKFIASDLHLDRGAIGLLASVFFYSYAVFQMPWGIASDKFGSRRVVGLGILLTAATMLGFATGRTEGALLFWRAAAGIAGAAVYVSLTGNIARWFPDRERSISQATLGGVGGALGEGMAGYATDVYIAKYGLALNQAVVAGGLLALAAYSLIGRAMGCPLAGKITDMFAKRGVSRTAVLIGWLIFAIIMLQLLSTGVSTI